MGQTNDVTFTERIKIPMPRTSIHNMPIENNRWDAEPYPKQFYWKEKKEKVCIFWQKIQLFLMTSNIQPSF